MHSLLLVRLRCQSIRISPNPFLVFLMNQDYRLSTSSEADFWRVTQLVFRFSLVPRILGSYDGPNDLCPAPDIDTTSAFHGGLLWVHCAYFIFLSWGKHSLNPENIVLLIY